MPMIPEVAWSGGPFDVDERLTVYEAAMVYSGRHPGGVFLSGKTKKPEENHGRASVDDHEIYLGRNAKDGDDHRKLAWNIYCELLRRIEAGKIKPIRCTYKPTGELDPRDTLIRTSELAQLANERGERPKFLAHLLHCPEAHTGMPGRPQKARELILAELEARASRGESEPTLAKEARALLCYLETQHPTVARPTLKTVENNIRKLYRKELSWPPRAITR